MDETPSEVVLKFNEPVEPGPTAVQVFDADGGRVDLEDAARGDQPTVLPASLPQDLADGQYTVAWRAISADTHPVGGAFVFGVSEVVETTAAPVTASGARDLDRLGRPRCGRPLAGVRGSAGGRRGSGVPGAGP